jgi:cytochrome c-type biogenesis protein CcmH
MLRALLLFLMMSTAQASSLYPLATPEQDQLFKKMLSNFRCLVCQNQNLLDSNATLAQDLRKEVYELLQQGKSESDIHDYLLKRYGEFVLYEPPLTNKTALLWFGPFVILIIGIATLIITIRRQETTHD